MSPTAGYRVLDFLLQRLYSELAWAYDLVSWVTSLGRWARWRQVALRYLRGERVLEVGCGTGRLLLQLAGRGQPLWGCDLSAAMLRQARRQVGPAVPLCRARTQALPFSHSSFDTVVCTFPAGYIRDAQTWAEFERVLAPGGRAVVVYGVSVGEKTLGGWLIRSLLSLGHTSGSGLRPAWDGCQLLEVQHLVVPEGRDRVGLLLAERRAA